MRATSIVIPSLVALTAACAAATTTHAIASPVAEPGVQVSYWVIEGRTADEAVQAEQFSSNLAPVLAGITHEYGPTTFHLVDRLDVTSSVNAHGEAEGHASAVEQEIQQIGDVLLAAFTLRAAGSHIKTRLRLRSGETALVGQVGHESPGNEAARLFYIARATLQ